MVSELQAGMGDGHELPVVMIFAVGFEKAFRHRDGENPRLFSYRYLLI